MTSLGESVLNHKGSPGRENTPVRLMQPKTIGFWIPKIARLRGSQNVGGFTEDKIIPVSAKYVVTMANLSPKMHKIYKDIIEEESNTFEEFVPLGNENEMLN